MSTFQKGDIIQMQVPDERWWPRFKAWVLHRPPPTQMALMEIKDTVTSAFPTADGQALWIGREIAAGDGSDDLNLRIRNGGR